MRELILLTFTVIVSHHFSLTHLLQHVPGFALLLICPFRAWFGSIGTTEETMIANSRIRLLPHVLLQGIQHCRGGERAVLCSGEQRAKVQGGSVCAFRPQGNGRGRRPKGVCVCVCVCVCV